MARLGLNMHIGSDNKSSKTGAVFFPSRKTMNEWLIKYENMKISSISENNIIVDINKKKKFSDEAIKKMLEDCYNKASETKDIIIDGNGFISFTKFFKYLGNSYRTTYLTNTK